MTEQVPPEESDLPTAVWSGNFHVFGVDLKCHVLSDGRRIIEADSLQQMFVAMVTSDDPGDLAVFARWQRGIKQ